MLAAAEQHYRTQQALADRTTRELAALWGKVDPADIAGTWQRDRAVVLLSAAQTLAAGSADAYTSAVLTEQGLSTRAAGQVSARGFAGVASDGRPLASLLSEPVIAAKVGLARGFGMEQALGLGLSSLVRIGGTQVQDAGRQAESVALTARPAATGYVRMLSLPSCARCTVLAGRFYGWNAGFQRHPLCDCRHIPSSESLAGDLVTSPRRAIESGRVTGLSRADRQAIAEGADVGQVINAQRGLYTADAYGQRVKATQEGVTARAVAGSRFDASRSPRLRPEAIYRYANGDRTEALRLLRRFGYLL